MKVYFLRRATYADSDIAYQIKRNALKEYVEQIWEWKEDFPQQHHAEHFSPAYMDMILVDDYTVGLIRKKEKKDCIFIYDFYLVPEFQGQGIGSQLIRQVQEESRRKEKPIRLEVLRINKKAISFYKKHRFVRAGRKPQKWIMEWRKYKAGPATTA